MNRKEVEEYVADWRQILLTRQLGQVECFAPHTSWWMADSACPWCKAVV